MFLITLRKIAVVLLVGLSLLFSAQNFLSLIKAGFLNPQNAAKNEIVIWENRFQALKHELPVDVSHIGYIAESDFPNHEPLSETDEINEFRITRYVMAPVVVVRGFDYPWMIGNFSSSAKFKLWLNSKIGNYEIQEFSGGIYLIHKVQK